MNRVVAFLNLIYNRDECMGKVLAQIIRISATHKSV